MDLNAPDFIPQSQLLNAPDFIPQSLRTAEAGAYDNTMNYEQAITNDDIAFDCAFVSYDADTIPDPQTVLFSELDRSAPQNSACLDVPVVDPNRFYEPVSSEKFRDETAEQQAGWRGGTGVDDGLSVQSLADDNDAVFHHQKSSSEKISQKIPTVFETEKLAEAKQKYGDFATGWIRYEFGKDSSASLARCEARLRDILHSRTKVVGVVGQLVQSNKYASDEENGGDGSLFYAIASGSLLGDLPSLSKGMLEHREFADRERTLITMYVKTNVPVVFIKVHGMFAPLPSADEDSDPLAQLEKVATLAASGGDLMKLFQDWQYTYAKALSLIFSFSHIVLWLSSSSGLSLNDLRMLKLVDTYRLSIADEILKRTRENMSIYEHFANEARLCTPRLLIVHPKGALELFEFCAAETEPAVHEQHIEQLYAAVHRADEHLYQCLFKSRLIAGDSVGSGLVVLRDSMPAVHFIAPAASLVDFHPSKLFYSTLTEVDHFTVAERAFYTNLDEFVGLHLAEICDCNYKAAEFHNDWSFPSVLPHFRDWLHGLTRAYKFVFSNYEHASSANRNRSNEPLRRQLCIMDDVQRSICYSAVQRAFGAFKRGILPSSSRKSAVIGAGDAERIQPPHIITKWDYDLQLLEAMKVFYKRARGSDAYITEYATLLRYRCWKYYERHQPCGVLSLYGSPCLRRPHITPEEGDDAEALAAAADDAAAMLIMRKLPPAARARVLWHKADFEERMKCVCPCGRMLGQRDEPFSVRDANWALYKKLRKLCCSKLAGAKEPSSGAYGPMNSKNTSAAAAAAAAAVLAANVEDDSGSQIIMPGATTAKQSKADTNDAVERQQGFSNKKSAEQQNRRRRVLDYDTDDEDDDDDELDNEPVDDGSDEDGEDDAESPVFAENALLDSKNDRRFGKNYSNDEKSLEDDTNAAVGGEIVSTTTRSRRSTHTEDASAAAVGADVQLRQKSRTRRRNGRNYDGNTGDIAPAQQPVQFTSPQMLQEGMLPGTIPLFTSWQLFCVGPSHCYNHESGLRPHFQPGFLASFCHLIPFIENVELRREHVISVRRPLGAPPPRDRDRDRDRSDGSHRKTQSHTEQQQRLGPGVARVKLFMGFEYECPAGHRLMYRNNMKQGVIKSNLSNSDVEPWMHDEILKAEAARIREHGLPLFVDCPCRKFPYIHSSQAPYNYVKSLVGLQQKTQFLAGTKMVAQLMRIHVVSSPRMPVRVRLRPRISIDAAVPSFMPAMAFTAPKGEYSVLKMPNFYQDSLAVSPTTGEPLCLPPVGASNRAIFEELSVPECVMLPGFYQITEDDADYDDENEEEYENEGGEIAGEENQENY